MYTFEALIKAVPLTDKGGGFVLKKVQATHISIAQNLVIVSLREWNRNQDIFFYSLEGMAREGHFKNQLKGEENVIEI